MLGNKKYPTFPRNHGWVCSGMHNFKPRDVNDATLQMLAETLIKGDKKFEHLLRECKDSWIVSITIGKDTLHIRLYDPKDVDGGTNQVLSTSLNLARTAFIEINRNKDIRKLDVTRIQRVLTTAPFMYAERCLHPDEVRICDVLERAAAGEVYAPDEEFPTPDLSSPAQPTTEPRPHWSETN